MNYLISKGHFAFRVQNGAIYDPTRHVFRKRGFMDPKLTDIMGVLKGSGKIITIEVKNAATADRIKGGQRLFAQEITSRGGFHCFAFSYPHFLGWYHTMIGRFDLDERAAEISREIIKSSGIADPEKRKSRYRG